MLWSLSKVLKNVLKLNCALRFIQVPGAAEYDTMLWKIRSNTFAQCIIGRYHTFLTCNADADTYTYTICIQHRSSFCCHMLLLICFGFLLVSLLSFGSSCSLLFLLFPNISVGFSLVLFVFLRFLLPHFVSLWFLVYPIAFCYFLLFPIVSCLFPNTSHCFL